MGVGGRGSSLQHGPWLAGCPAARSGCGVWDGARAGRFLPRLPSPRSRGLAPGLLLRYAFTLPPPHVLTPPSPCSPCPPRRYIPFSGGPRKCVGDQFALMEAVVALTVLLRQYDFSLVPNQTVGLLGAAGGGGCMQGRGAGEG